MTLHTPDTVTAEPIGHLNLLDHLSSSAFPLAVLRQAAHGFFPKQQNAAVGCSGLLIWLLDAQPSTTSFCT